MVKFTKFLYDLNTNIRNIKGADLQPITLKSPADIVERYIKPKGNSEEGEFYLYKDYVKEMEKRNSQLTKKGEQPLTIDTKEEFENTIREFASEYKEQLTLSGELRHQAGYILEMLEDAKESALIDNYKTKIKGMSRRDLIKLIKEVGEESNEMKRTDPNYDSFQFYTILNKKLTLLVEA